MNARRLVVAVVSTAVLLLHGARPAAAAGQLTEVSGARRTSPPPSARQALPTGVLPTIAGWYYRGDGLGVNTSVEIRKDGTFRAHTQGDVSPQFNHSETAGKIIVRDGVIHFSPPLPTDFGGSDPEDATLAIVPWGRRIYLVRLDKIGEFCSAVNKGMEPRNRAYGLYFLRASSGGPHEEDWNKSVCGYPDLPAPYRKYLLEEPIRGKVISVLAGRRAWINIGAHDRIVPGMLLVAIGRPGDWPMTDVKVISVTSDRALGEDTDDVFKKFVLRVGGSVISRLLSDRAAQPCRQ
jgi:hypothetical protein